jgi:hypothetical protein
MTMAPKKAAATIVRAAIQELAYNDNGLWFVGVIRSKCWSDDNAPLQVKARPIAADSTAIAQLANTDLK